MGTLSRGLFLIAGLGIGLGEPLSKDPRLDRFGDPLPEGAIARIGSSRLRHFWGASCPVLSPDKVTPATVKIPIRESNQTKGN